MPELDDPRDEWPDKKRREPLNPRRDEWRDKASLEYHE